MAGVEYGGWMFEEGDVENKFRYSLQTVSAVVTWHPGQQDAHWGGFYLRAGYTDMQIDGELFEEARFVPLALTLNWYWN